MVIKNAPASSPSRRGAGFEKYPASTPRPERASNRLLSPRRIQELLPGSALSFNELLHPMLDRGRGGGRATLLVGRYAEEVDHREPRERDEMEQQQPHSSADAGQQEARPGAGDRQLSHQHGQPQRRCCSNRRQQRHHGQMQFECCSNRNIILPASGWPPLPPHPSPCLSSSSGPPRGHQQRRGATTICRGSACRRQQRRTALREQRASPEGLSRMPLQMVGPRPTGPGPGNRRCTCQMPSP